MITYGAMRMNDQIPVPPDTIGIAVISSAGAVVAQDWPTGAQLVSFSAQQNIWVNMRSTFAGFPSTNSSGTTASSGLNELNPTIRQISTGWSTGYSITAATSGIVSLSFWRK